MHPALFQTNDVIIRLTYQNEQLQSKNEELMYANTILESKLK